MRFFFEEVVRLTNEFEPDFVAITGDLFDNLECLPWIERTYSQLQSKHGVYFVLGNHEVKIAAVDQIRQRLVQGGLIDLGSRFMEVEMRGTKVLLAGNELPWITPAADMGKISTIRFR